MTKKEKPKIDRVARKIKQLESLLARRQRECVQIRKYADEDVRAIEEKCKVTRILLEAWKSGQLT